MPPYVCKVVIPRERSEPRNLALAVAARNGAVAAVLFCLALAAGRAGAAEPDSPTRLPDGVPPVIGCWFWSEDEFKPDGHRAFLDLVSRRAAYNLLTTSLRLPKLEVTDEAVRARVKEAAAYARARGMGLVMDLDVRLARAAFQKKYPDELQEMLRLREVELSGTPATVFGIASDTPSDHYTFRATPYIPLSGRLVRVYSYVRGPEGIEPDTLADITARCEVREASAKQVTVAIPAGADTAGRRAAVVAAFTHFTPDVFAPHLMEFQRDIIARYADAPLAGVCKDEWGFPPCYDGCPAKNDFWFSPAHAAAYAERTGGRDLVRDCLLMHAGERGRKGERQAAINHFMEMCWQRNARIEDDFYKAAKAAFGPAAVVGTHPTWWPYPGTREFKKNGLDWWAATRDLAQTDEVTPFCVRTALAKKWGSPVWYNMYYAPSVAAYEKAVWTHALAGGRVNYHPLYPHPFPSGEMTQGLLRGGLMRGDCRVRLLNFISRRPLDCPVAVVFGHACAMNWAGPAYDDVGIGVSDGLWRAGFPADLIPSSEIRSKALKVGDSGHIQYGPQRYAALVLYHPEFERPETAAFFQEAASGKTALFCVGDWTTDFEGKPFAGRAALPSAMAACADGGTCVREVIARLRAAGIEPQTPATEALSDFGRRSACPSTRGQCRLIDGTVILLAGEKQVTGDPIQATFEVKGRKVTVDAVGVAAVRLADDGTLEALAAGGLRQFEAGATKITLDPPADLALWREADGKTRGVLQDYPGPVPAALTTITSNWLRLEVPKPLAN